jgi:hypothetical protein
LRRIRIFCLASCAVAIFISFSLAIQQIELPAAN